MLKSSDCVLSALVSHGEGSVQDSSQVCLLDRLLWLLWRRFEGAQGAAARGGQLASCDNSLDAGRTRR